MKRQTRQVIKWVIPKNIHDPGPQRKFLSLGGGRERNHQKNVSNLYRMSEDGGDIVNFLNAMPNPNPSNLNQLISPSCHLLSKCSIVLDGLRLISYV